MSSESDIDFKERQWLAKHLQGDKLAFAELMAAYRKPVYSYLVRCGLDKSTRDDLFQDVFFKIHKSAHGYKKSKRLSPWIFTIAVNTVRNHIREQKPEHKHISLHTTEVSVLQLLDNNPTPEIITQSKHKMQWVLEAMQDLPQVQSEALNLTLIQGMKLAEAAKLLKLPLSTIKTHVRRARQGLIESYKSLDSAVSNRSIS